MGYKTAEGKFKRTNRSLDVSILMVEDPAQLASVIISGDKVSMVIKGDTTVFNAAAFFTAEDSPLRTLLSQMPGIELKENSIIANGKSVSKILLNGKAIFGTDINSALDLMYSKDVKSVKVYDQYDQSDYTIRDSLDRKERVLDIISKIPLNKVSGFNLGASVSSFRGYSAFTSGAYFDLDKPTLKIDAQYTKTPEDPNCTSSNSLLLIQSNCQSSRKRLNASFGLNYSSMYSKNRNSQITEYIPSELFEQKSESLETLNDNNNSTLSSTFTLNKTLKSKRDKFGVNITYSHTRQNVLNSKLIESIMNGESISLSNTDYLDSTKTDNVSLVGSYLHRFSKSGRSFSFKARGEFKQNTIVSDRRDLSPTSTDPVYLDTDSKGLDCRFTLSGSFSEPIAKDFSLSLGYDNIINKLDYSKYAFDHILDYQDMINSAAYSQSSVNNIASALLRYKVKYLDLKLGLQAEDMTDRRLESIPTELDENKHYFHLSPSLRLTYTSSLINVNLNYIESQSIPVLNSLRSQVDNSNLMHLSAGNPSLKQSINRGFDLTASFTFPKIEGNLILSSKASFVSDYITSRIIYFTSDTTLPDYNYTFPEGSDLRIPVNIDGKWDWSCSLSASKRFGRINSTLGTTLTYKRSNTPYYKQDVLYNSLSSNYAASFMANCAFSSRLSFNLNANYEKGNSYDNSLQTISSDNANAWASLTYYPWKCLQTQVNVSCTYLKYSKAFPANFYSNLAASVFYSFGKKDEFSIGFRADNLLNESYSYSLKIDQDKITNSQNFNQGRYFTLSFRWKLK
ncbi:MAG: outer membrane beta-barrel protein [Candidatus Cryptobacteroides sp.]